MTELAEFPEMPEYSRSRLLGLVGRAEPLGALEPSAGWTDEHYDWGLEAREPRPRERKATPGWAWLRGGRGEGTLLGGCVESLEHLRGTPHWPDWQGAILFLESSTVGLSLAKLDSMLTDYRNMGVLDTLRGLLFGRVPGMDPDGRRLLHDVLLRHTEPFGFPVVADMDFGHTSPMFTLPVGCRARIDADARSFGIVEAAVTRGA